MDESVSGKAKDFKSFKQNLLNFWNFVVLECQDSILFDDFFIHKISSYIIAIAWSANSPPPLNSCLYPPISSFFSVLLPPYFPYIISLVLLFLSYFQFSICVFNPFLPQMNLISPFSFISFHRFPHFPFF